MEWVASTLTPPPNVSYPALLKLMRTPRLPAVDLTDAPTDLNGLVRFGERRNLVCARVPSRSARAITTVYCKHHMKHVNTLCGENSDCGYKVSVTTGDIFLHTNYQALSSYVS